MSNKFTLDLVGNVDLKGMAVDICFNKITVASVNYEKGVKHMEIEILTDHDNSQKIVFPLQDFINILEASKKLAMKCAKEDETIEWPKMDRSETEERGDQL